jgi:hypothetical protein
MEEKQKYEFIKTISRAKQGTSGYEYVAMIADAEVLAEDGISVESMRSASRQESARGSFNAAVIRMRKGVHLMTKEQLAERLQVLKEQKLDKSVAAFERAIECIAIRDAQFSGPTPAVSKYAPA